MDGLDEGTRLDKMVSHENGVTLVSSEHGDGISGDLWLHWRNHYTSTITKSTITQGTA